MNQPQLDKYQPGAVLTVGSHHVRIIKYLTSGGFAQIYSCQLSQPDEFIKSDIACVKRVIVPDKGSLNTLRAEVEAMKLLRNNDHVVSYIDSHAAKSTTYNGSYEVFLLMEFCERGGLIDFMNTRLQNRLQEFEVLSIIMQIAEGVAAMHALKPPLVHRDLKIENVLISSDNKYKVCDFGSVCGVIRPPTNPQEMAFVQHDIMKNTTAQYRSPEMIDLYRGLPIDEKSDIWALGVLLYKLCYYTTPFEKGGETAILYSRYDFPPAPMYSENVKNLVRWMLLENPNDRPNIYQVVQRASQLLGVPCPIIDFYNVTYQLQHTNSMPQLNMLAQGYAPHSLGSTPQAMTTQNTMQQAPMQFQIPQQQQQGQFQTHISHSFAPTQGELAAGMQRVNTAGAGVGAPLHESKTIPAYSKENAQTSQLPKQRASKSKSSSQPPIQLSPVSTSSSESDSPDEDRIIETINLPPRRRYNVPISSRMSSVQVTKEDMEKTKALEKKIKDAISASRKEYEDSSKDIESSIIEENNSLFNNKKDHDIKTESVDDTSSPSLMKNIEKFNEDSSAQLSNLSLNKKTEKKPSPPPVRSRVKAPEPTEVEDKEESQPAPQKHLTPEQKLQNDKTKELLRQKMREKLDMSGKAFVSRHKKSDTGAKSEISVEKEEPARKPKPKPTVPHKPNKLRPQKPTKPSFLSGNKISNKA